MSNAWSLLWWKWPSGCLDAFIGRRISSTVPGARDFWGSCHVWSKTARQLHYIRRGEVCDQLAHCIGCPHMPSVKGGAYRHFSNRDIDNAFRGPYATVADRNNHKRKLEEENRELKAERDRLNAALILAKSECTLKGENEMLKMFATSDALTIADQQRKIRELEERLEISRENGARIEEILSDYEPSMRRMKAKVVSVRGRTKQLGDWYRSALDKNRELEQSKERGRTAIRNLQASVQKLSEENDVLRKTCTAFHYAAMAVPEFVRKAEVLDKLLPVWDIVLGALHKFQEEFACPVSFELTGEMIVAPCGHHVSVTVFPGLAVHSDSEDSGDDSEDEGVLRGRKCPMCRAKINHGCPMIALKNVADLMDAAISAAESYKTRNVPR